MNPTLRRARVAAVALTTVATLAAAAGAASGSDEPAPAKSGLVATGSVSDPDDTLGRLDIGRVSDRTVEVRKDRYLISYRVRTLTPFGTARLDVADRNFVLELNRDGERGSERNVRIAERNGDLVAEVISNASREVIGTVPASRPSDRTVQISGPRRLIGARSYFWTSNFHARHSPGCGRGDGFPIVCQDDVPQDGWLRLQHPAWPMQDAHPRGLAKRSEALG
jgi:hypothetical protein